MSLHNELFWMYLGLPNIIIMRRSFWDSFKATLGSFWKSLRQYEERIGLNLYSTNILRPFKCRNILECLWLSREFLKVRELRHMNPWFFYSVHGFTCFLHFKTSSQLPFKTLQKNSSPWANIVSSPTEF